MDWQSLLGFVCEKCGHYMKINVHLYVCESCYCGV